MSDVILAILGAYVVVGLLFLAFVKKSVSYAVEKISEEDGITESSLLRTMAIFGYLIIVLLWPVVIVLGGRLTKSKE